MPAGAERSIRSVARRIEAQKAYQGLPEWFKAKPPLEDSRPRDADSFTEHSARHALATTPDHEAGKRCSFAVEIPVARLGHLSIYERSSPATDTILHDAVNYFT